VNDIQTIAPVGPAAGAKMRDDVNGGWPGLLQRFVAEAERAA
jgi:hypothetical protein